MDNYFQNIFPKMSGSQETTRSQFLVVLTHFVVVEDTRTHAFCYPGLIRGDHFKHIISSNALLIRLMLTPLMPIFVFAVFLLMIRPVGLLSQNGVNVLVILPEYLLSEELFL